MRKRDVAGQGKSVWQLSKRARRWVSELKSSVSHLVAPPGPAPKLIFDQLEPRLLLSADPIVIDLSALQPAQPTHDVVVRLMDEVVTTGNQAVNIERVQTVDANNPAMVLSSQVITPGSNVTVLAGQGNDKITIDLSSLPQSAAQPSINVVGGGGDVTLGLIENAGQSAGWHLDDGGAGHIDAGVQIGFTGVDHLLGGGADTLYGSAADTNWTIDGAGSGSVGATKFAGFASLVGPSGQNDVFNVTSSGSLQGSIDGGGQGTLAINVGSAVAWHLNGGGTGEAEGPVQVAFTGVDHLVGSGSDTLYGSTTDNAWTIDGAGSGEVGAVSFGGFSNLVGATGQNNVFTVTSTGSLAGNIDGGGDGTLVINAGNADSFTSVFTGAHSGNETFDGDTINYTGMLPLVNSGSITNVNYQISTNNNLLTPTTDHVELYYNSTAGDAHFGDMVLQSLDGEFETTYFTAPTGSLSINVPDTSNINGGGGSGADSLTIMSLAPGFHANLNVNLLYEGYDPFATGLLPSSGPGAAIYQNSIFVTGNLDTNGGSVNLIASNIYVGTVAGSTSQSGSSFADNATYTGVTGTGGAGTGLTATITTDGSGNATAVITGAGTGYKTGDTVTFGVPDGSSGDTVSVTLANAANSADISTENSSGNAGAIALGMVGTNTVGGSALVAGGTFVALGPNATLDATANAVGGKAGAITVATSDIGQRLISAPVDFTNKNANIVIDGATIEGGSVTISATASDTNITTDAPSNLTGFTGNLGTLLNQIPGVALSSFLGIDASVVLRGANATINVDNATITSNNAVSIKATTAVTTQVSAITEGVGAVAAATGLSLAAGYGQATTDVEANILGSTSINAVNSISISATGKSADSVQAYADSNLFTNVNPNAVSIALAGAYNNLTALATVSSGSSITSTEGNINVSASGTQTTKPDARTYSPVDGAGGVAVGLDWETANVKASVNGKLTTLAPEGAVGVDNSEAQTFTGASVGPDGLTITIPNNGFSTGELVVYQPEINAVTALTPVWEPGTQTQSIGGLTAGSTYTVLVVGNNEIQLTKAAPLDIAAIGTNIQSVQSLNVVSTDLFSTDAIDSSSDIIIPGYGFANGDQVQYSDGGNTPISGLQNDGIYTVKVVDDQTFQLLDSGGNLIQISQVDQSGNIALGEQTFTDLTNTSVAVASVNLAYIDAAHNAVDVQGISSIFALGSTTEVNYESLANDGSNSIGGLTNESFYNLRPLTANSFQLFDETTGALEQLSDPGGAATQALSYISSIDNFHPNAVTLNSSNNPVDSTGAAVTNGGVDSTTDNIVLPKGDGVLANGTAVIYEVDQTVQTTESLVFELNAISAAANTIYIPNNGLTNGALVTYNPGAGNTAITGLNTTDTYEVVDVNPQSVSGIETSDTFQLFDETTKQLAQISQGGALGTQTFTDAADQVTATFTLASINTSSDTIQIAGNGFTGTSSAPTDVNYAVLNGSAIGGLSNGGEYNLVAVGPNAFQLYAGKTLVSLANAAGPSVGVVAAHNYYVASGFVPNQAASASAAFELDAVNSTNNTIYIAGNSLVNGATVTYDPGTDSSGQANASITGLTSGATYTVVDFNSATGQLDTTLTSSDYFSLKDASGNIVHISQGNALGTHTFTDTADNVAASVTLASISADGKTINLEDHGFIGTTTVPQTLNYELLAGTGIGGLSSGGLYNIVSTGSNTFQIYNKTTGQVVTLTDPGAPAPTPSPT